MIRLTALVFCCCSLLVLVAPAHAVPPEEVAQKPAETANPVDAEKTGSVQVQSPTAAALREKIAALPATGTDEELNERTAIAKFYDIRAYAPLLVAANGLTVKAAAAVAEMKNAAAWGLDPRDFAFAELSLSAPGAPELAPGAVAAAELDIAVAVSKYARFARGGRIIHPGGQLNSHLDRRPQFLKPIAVLEGLASVEDAAAYLRSLNPQHPQFEKLRQRYLASPSGKLDAVKVPAGPALTPGMTHANVAQVRKRLGLIPAVTAADLGDPNLYDEELRKAVVFFQQDRGLKPGDGVIDDATRSALNKEEATGAQRLLANMEQWRWMPANMGDLYIQANVPEFMLRVMKDGTMIHTERIVAGETGKQTTIFSRPLRHIVLRPKWRVPESIKVKELWPSLLRGGGLMREYGLQLETKDGQPLDYRTIDWRKDDIRNYEVTQPPGRKSVLGNVKFSFPSQHTIYMHDTPDKYMFNSTQRTLSHGCLRLRDPMKLAELLLAIDKGWDRAQLDELSRNGPLNNEIAITRRIPIHITYFTLWVGDAGDVRAFRDVYGHEKRITQALDGQWDRIAKGPDHLAPPEPNRALANAEFTDMPRSRKNEDSVGDLIGSALGRNF